MKNGILATLLLLMIGSAGQQPTSRRTSKFQWNDREARTASKVLGTSKDIGTADRDLLLSAFAQQLKGYPKPEELAAQTRVEFVDLNGDGMREVIAQPVGDLICSPTGNCPIWAFQKTPAGYRLILRKSAAQTFTIQPNRTNGFSDLVLGMHGSATEQGLFVYRFRERKYRRTDCYNAEWTYLGSDGQYHDLEEPRIIPCK